MKKKIIIAMVMGAILVGSMVACGRVHHIGDETSAGERTHFAKDIAIEGIDKIKIDIEAANVKINKSTGDKVEVVADVSKYSKGIEVDSKGSTLLISEEFNDIELFDNDHSDITITIPEKYDKDFKYTYGASESYIEDIKVNNMEINGGAGMCSISDVVFKDLDMKMGAGATKIKLSEECGKINIDGGVGKFEISFAKVGGDFSYKGGIGEANIKVPENAPITIKGQSGLGEFNQKAKVSSEGKYDFDIKTGVGKVTIEN